MPSTLTHALAGAAVVAVLLPRPSDSRTLLVAAAAATLPDLDILGKAVGFASAGVFGHRGITHSLFFAALVAGTLTAALRARGWEATAPPRLWLACFLAAASHGLLDACTDAGRGVALLAPFSVTRHFLDWRPISGPRLADGTVWELLLVRWREIPFIWAPAALALRWRRRR